MTNGSELQHIEQSVAALQALSGDVYVGRLACPMENFEVLANLGVLIGHIASTPGSLIGIALCAIPAKAFDQMVDDHLVSPEEWFCRYGVDAMAIPADLSDRNALALRSDRDLCLWKLAVRTSSADVVAPSSLRMSNQWCHRVFDAPTAEITRIERDLARVELELVARNLSPSPLIFIREINPHVLGQFAPARTL